MRARRLALATAVLVAAATATAISTGETMHIVRWTPPAIASDQYESSPTFSPDGREMFFMRGNREFSAFTLWRSTCTPNGWSAPEPVSFAAQPPASDADPFITLDGQRLYFVSTRSFAGKRGDGDFDIWFVERTAAGDWGPAVRLPEPVNSPHSELMPRLTRDGRIYFGSDRPGGQGGTDIYVATPLAGGRWRVDNLGADVNTAGNDYEAEISRDEQSLVVVSDRGDRSHLYRYTWTDGRWREAGRIPARADVFQVGPLLSPRGDRLLFAQADGEQSGELFLADLVPEPDPSWPPDGRCALRRSP
jgi:Tol biopolymer transport system component